MGLWDLLVLGIGVALVVSSGTVGIIAAVVIIGLALMVKNSQRA